MKTFFVKPALCLFLISVLHGTAQAQKARTETQARSENKEVQQIIITRKGDKGKKTVIEIKGDQVTINGKDASKSGDVTVNLNDIRGLQFRNGRTNAGFNFNFENDAMDDFEHDAMDGDHFSLFTEDSSRAMLGVVTDGDAAGAKITAITRGSAAAKAGLKVGDVIMKIGNESVKGTDDVAFNVRAHKPGEKIAVAILRDGKPQTVTAELGNWKGVRLNSFNAAIAPAAPMPPGDFNTGPHVFSYSTNGPKLGLSVQDTDDGNGVKVLSVTNGGMAEKAGIKAGDILTKINGDDVNTTDDVVEIMRDARDEKTVKLQVLRAGKPQTFDVAFPRRLKTANL